MCGIFGYKSLIKLNNIDFIKEQFYKSSHRGPDDSKFINIVDNTYFGFHRLSIMDISVNANQPLYHIDYPNIKLICNGEIYNFKSLKKKYNITETIGNSDCEIILHLYNKIGWLRTIKELDGVFACALYDGYTDELFLARDPFGVRPLYYSHTKDSFIFTSELISIDKISDNVLIFKPGYVAKVVLNKLEQQQYFNISKIDFDNTLYQIKSTLENAVEKRMMSDREIGCLLSGGLDSSLIAALVSKYHKKLYPNKQLLTFTIGMKGGTDLEYARIVAEHIGSKHHEVILDENDFCEAIEIVIHKIGSDDTTTIRASIGNYLISKHISENFNCKVIFNGDGADEVCGGYIYLQNAKNPDDYHQEILRLLNDIHLFDVLRSDRCMSTNGLEARTPFLDKQFVNTYLSIDPNLRMTSYKNQEKYLLRKAFDNTNILPNNILWRKKEAFSDGVSNTTNTTQSILYKYISKKWTPNNTIYTIKEPLLLESKYYTHIYNQYYSKKSRYLIPYYWMPKWVKDITDPSARELDNYLDNSV